MSKNTMSGNSTPMYAEDEIRTEKVVQVVNCAKLNVRKEPRPNAEIIGMVTKGDVLVMDPWDNDPKFYKITMANGDMGYISKKYAETL